MRNRRSVPADHPPFAELPVSMIETRDTRVRMAVHIAGSLSDPRPPLVCLAGLNRNMSDYANFLAFFRRAEMGNWPVLLIDLPGRGRADDRMAATDYSSIADARDVADCLAALGIPRAVILGQGHGGHVAMALTAAHPLLIAGTILLDAGPVVDSRGIVRLRNNLAHVEGLRGAKLVTAGFRRMMAGDYPGLSDEALDRLALRSHFSDKRGRAQPLYDRCLLAPLAAINFDDVLTPQWPLFDALSVAPLMILRTQLTDQLRRETFEEMVRRRPDAIAYTIAGQGSPALFDQPEEIAAISRFVSEVGTGKRKTAAA
ncbi:MAG: alpha/beta hydrolase [Devosia sp.]|uniref:alpha/beta fold hydrolase n=1 Tax=unclassified Devosia TaxID=196773 RepID=UPI0019DD87B0|nr:MULTISPECIES: alpha/beta hydrolase [unclassified Devosia]MBF0679707.1 alpha/beta hydrolase [Devosia sp.]WEJ32124.1 alpha/beta hydrolase [Devosia sp. SD17-2]